jgi:hypothetical protein
MITSFEVGTVFKIIDRASPVVRGLIADMTRLEAISGKAKRNFQSLGAMRLGNLTRGVSNLTDQAVKMDGVFSKTFVGMAADADASIKQTQALAAEWRNVAQAARSAGIAVGSARRVSSVPGASFGGRGNAGGGRGFLGAHLSQHGELPGGTRLGVRGSGLAGNAALALAGAFGYGVYEDAQLRGTVARMMLAAGQPLTPNMMSTPMGAAIRNAIQQGSAETGLSAKEIEASASKLVLQMGGTPFNKRVGMLPDVFRFAGIESQLKGVEAGEATQSLVGLLHMTGAYKPEEMKKLAGSLAFASTISPVGLPGIERAASYVLPMGVNALGFDPASLLLVMAQAQSAGILSGKSGTWFQGMFQSLSPKAGFASLISSKGAAGRRSGLRELGLVDEGGAPTGLRMLEQNDWAGFIQTVKSHLDAIPQEKRMGIVSEAMGSQQAARGLMTLMLPGMIALLPELQREQKQFAQDPAGTLNAIAAASPLLQFQRTWEETSNVLMDIGSMVMPPVLAGLRGLDTVLKDISGPISWITQKLGAKPQGATSSDGGISGFWGAIKEGATGGAIAGGTVGIFSGPGVVPSAVAGAAAGAVYMGGTYLFRPNPLSGARDNSNIIIPGPGAPPISSVPADGLLHKMSYTGPIIRGADTWSDIGQGAGEGGTFPILSTATGGDFATIGGGGGGGVIMASLGPPGAGRISRGAPITSGGAVAGALPVTPDAIGPNAFIQARRQSFANELKDPNKRLLFGAMLLSEGNPVQTAESAMNRADFTHKSLMQALNVGSDGLPLSRNGNFYGPIKHGKLPAFIARLKRDPKLRARINGAIDAALNYSDTIQGSTDQGMVTDPNGAYIASHFHVWGKGHGNIYGDWNGPGGHAASSRWRQQFEAAKAAANRAPHWTTGDISSAVNGGHDAAIPPPPQQVHTTPISLKLDGRVVAESTMKHIIKASNGPARGPRTADYTSVRPINV